jgi:Mrp family chromosome partitioning ATPase
MVADTVEREVLAEQPAVASVTHDQPISVPAEPVAVVAETEPALEPVIDVSPVAAAPADIAGVEAAEPFEELVAAEAVETIEVEPKPAIAEEIAAEALVAVAQPEPIQAEPIWPEPIRPEPIRHEPLPEMRVERQSFSDAWERHKRTMDAARYDEPKPTADAAPATPAVEDEIEDQPAMRNPFARFKPTLALDTPVVEPTVEPAVAQPALGEVGIHRAAEMLIAGGATRAIFVSPEGDEGAAAAVMVSREVSDAGLRVLLIDLTASGAASRPMLDSVSYPGITNLLASEAQFTEVIHVDHYSECHVMPVGTADPMRAMKAADRLPVIMGSLTEAYDVVVVECGASDAEGIRRLVADGTEIMVSAIEPDSETTATAEALMARGYGRVMLVSPAANGSPDAPVPGRSAA